MAEVEIFQKPAKFDGARFRQIPVISALLLLIPCFMALAIISGIVLLAEMIFDFGFVDTQKLGTVSFVLMAFALACSIPNVAAFRQVQNSLKKMTAIDVTMCDLRARIASSACHENLSDEPWVEAMQATENVRHALNIARWKGAQRDNADIVAIRSFHEAMEICDEVATDIDEHVRRIFMLCDAAREMNATVDSSHSMKATMQVLKALSEVLFNPICEHGDNTCPKETLIEQYNKACAVMRATPIVAA